MKRSTLLASIAALLLSAGVAVAAGEAAKQQPANDMPPPPHGDRQKPHHSDKMRNKFKRDGLPRGFDELGLSEAQKSNAELTEQLAELQAQLSEAEHRIVQYDNETAQLRASLTDAKSEWQTQEKSLLDSVNAEKEALATQLAQEAERFRMEFALQTEQHEKSLNELNQMFNQQKEHLENENTQLQQQVEQLITQNHAYRALLQENANKIRALLDRLPALENNHEETTP